MLWFDILETYLVELINSRDRTPKHLVGGPAYTLHHGPSILGNGRNDSSKLAVHCLSYHHPGNATINFVILQSL